MPPILRLTGRSVKVVVWVTAGVRMQVGVGRELVVEYIWIRLARVSHPADRLLGLPERQVTGSLWMPTGASSSTW